MFFSWLLRPARDAVIFCRAFLTSYLGDGRPAEWWAGIAMSMSSSIVWRAVF